MTPIIPSKFLSLSMMVLALTLTPFCPIEKSEKDWEYFRVAGSMNPRFIPDGHGHAELVILVSHPHTLSPRKCPENNECASRVDSSVRVSSTRRSTAWMRTRRATCLRRTRRSRGTGKCTAGWTIRSCIRLERRCVETNLTGYPSWRTERVTRADEPRSSRFVSSPYFVLLYRAQRFCLSARLQKRY